jgi:hypothetical protein
MINILIIDNNNHINYSERFSCLVSSGRIIKPLRLKPGAEWSLGHVKGGREDKGRGFISLKQSKLRESGLWAVWAFRSRTGPNGDSWREAALI